MHTTALNELRRLLALPGRDPLELAGQLATARSQVTIDPAVGWQLDRLELAFLQQQALLAAAPAELGEAVARARLAELGVETRIAVTKPDDDPVALFDLAEQCAAYRAAGRDADVSRTRTELTRRMRAVALDARTAEEAHERYAALVTEEEDLSLAHKICLLEESGEVFATLATNAAPAVEHPVNASTQTRADGARENAQANARHSRELRSMAARMRRMACDRVLTRRLEKLLTRRGARALELTSLTFLIVVFGILLLEAWRDWTPATHHVFRMVDGAICLFFIAEFVLKLVLAPARVSWFLRHVLTDLLPAIPAALLFASVQIPETAGDAVLVRLMRLMRITYFARYIQALQPLLRLARLLLFLVKGMDGLVRRFSPLLNRNFVFFERMSVYQPRPTTIDTRQTLFRALRREHVLLEEAGIAAGSVLTQRANALHHRLERTGADADAPRPRRSLQRDIPVETAIHELYGLRADDLNQYLSDKDLRAVDRVVRVISAPVVRSLPIVRRFAVRDRQARSPTSRALALSTNIALYLESWRSRMVLYADLHGIITGPQVLDRVASAMMKASQRPAVRLLLWGGLFFVVRLLVGAKSSPGMFLQKFVAGPLVVFGSVCLVFLSLGWWLKKLAGEASENFKLTSEAQFIALLELLKSRREPTDAEFLARRVFHWEMPRERAAAALRAQTEATRQGLPTEPPEPRFEAQIQRISLLHLHYLDGGPLHGSDIRTTEQLLANQSLDNIRALYLTWTRKDKKRLKKLSLSDGSIFRGPYVWFSFITESVAVEAAKRITDYNRNCLTRAQQAAASPTARADFLDWLERRRSDRASRKRKPALPGRGQGYSSTEFCALDFLSGTKERDAYIGRMFGNDVLEVLRIDRRRMIREVFGMRPMHRLPRAQRSINLANFYRTRLSGGRILLLPAYLAIGFLRGIGGGVRKVAMTVREIVAPHKAARMRLSGRAPFSVALRKIHRMKAPSLLEAMRLRAAFDPEYCGAPATRGADAGFAERSELQRDMDFLHLSEREREEFVAQEDSMRRHIEHWQHTVPPRHVPGADAIELGLRERAQAIAWAADKDHIRSLWSGGAWLRDELVRLADPDLHVPVAGWRLMLNRLWWRKRHPVDVLLREHFEELTVSAHARTNLRRLWLIGDADLVAVVAAARSLPAGADWRSEAAARMASVDRDYESVNRDLAVVRAVQSLTVLDVRNYREMVFELGDYAADGEDIAEAKALP